MKIAFVGASGYGNIGDDTYPLVFAEHFRDCDRAVFNSDLPRSLPGDTSIVVLGGGGILFNSGECNATGESPHFRCMRSYMEWAIQKGIPWGIISCGFQFRPREEAPPAEVLRHWTPYLKQAQFITLRSPVCARIARELTGRTDVQFFPDLAYLYRPTVPGKPTRKRILTIVPAGVINPQNAFVQHVVRLHLSMGYQVQWLSMGSPGDDQHHLDGAAIRYSDAIILDQREPKQAFREIARSRLVVSGRYHGMVFARSLRIPFLVGQDAPHKIMSEDWTANPADAIGHVKTLRRFVNRLQSR